jgi:hypothetical protein
MFCVVIFSNLLSLLKLPQPIKINLKFARVGRTAFSALSQLDALSATYSNSTQERSSRIRRALRFLTRPSNAHSFHLHPILWICNCQVALSEKGQVARSLQGSTRARANQARLKAKSLRGFPPVHTHTHRSCPQSPSNNTVAPAALESPLVQQHSLFRRRALSTLGFPHL